MGQSQITGDRLVAKVPKLPVTLHGVSCVMCSYSQVVCVALHTVDQLKATLGEGINEVSMTIVDTPGMPCILFTSISVTAETLSLLSLQWPELDTSLRQQG